MLTVSPRDFHLSSTPLHSFTFSCQDHVCHPHPGMAAQWGPKGPTLPVLGLEPLPGASHLLGQRSVTVPSPALPSRVTASSASHANKLLAFLPLIHLALLCRAPREIEEAVPLRARAAWVQEIPQHSCADFSVMGSSMLCTRSVSTHRNLHLRCPLLCFAYSVIFLS